MRAQLARQEETGAIIQCVDAVHFRFTTTSRRDNGRPETISNGTSRIRDAKKSELTVYALSAYSCRGSDNRQGAQQTLFPVPCGRHPVLTGIGRHLATAPRCTITLHPSAVIVNDI